MHLHEPTVRELLQRLAELEKTAATLEDAIRDLRTMLAGGAESPTGANTSAAFQRIPRRMSVPEFAACVNRCPEVVRRRIRSRFITRELVEGRGRGSEYRIDRAALERFNVTLDVAAERLQAFRSGPNQRESVVGRVPL